MKEGPERDADAVLDMIDCAQRVLDYTSEGGRDSFFATRIVQDAVARNLEIMGEASKRVSAATRAARPDIPWRRISGMRDVLIHAYDDVDLEEVWAVVERTLPKALAALVELARDEGWRR